MLEKEYVLNVGPNGTFKDSGSYSTKPSEVDAMFARYEEEGVKKITLFFHGGLVNEKSGLETAKKMQEHFVDVGQTPICVVWETGLIETVASNLKGISKTKLVGKLIKIFVKKLSSKLGFDAADGRGAGVELSNAQIESELLKEIPFENYTQTKLQSAGRGSDPSDSLPSSAKELEADFKYALESDLELVGLLNSTELSIREDDGRGSRGIVSLGILIKHAAKIAFRVIKRFATKRDHDFYPTIIEEILRELYVADLGAWVWNEMKVKSNDMWSDNSQLSGDDQFAGRYLFDRLVEYYKKNPDIEVNLVGHSAGSIAICNLLKMSSGNYPDLVFNKVIFMAPACRVDLFRDEVVSHQERFKSFRMFTMTDENEKRDVLVPYFYTHSLLYLISGILENEGKDFDAYILGLERNIQALNPYDEVEEIIESNEFLFEGGSNRVVFSKSDEGAQQGLRTESLTHGGFDDDEATIESIKYLLS